MLPWKRLAGNCDLGASFITSCNKKMPERFYCVANVCAKRYMLHYFSKGQFPDLSIFRFSEMCSRENPIPSLSLSDLKLTPMPEPVNPDPLAPYLLAIDENICRMVIST